MLSKLKIDALRADLVATEALLAKAKAYGDEIGQIQFAYRKDQLLRELSELDLANEHVGKIALFFGGAPAIGSKGIEADFAGDAIAAFQDVVDRRMAAAELGEVGARGPVPLKRSAQLMVTDVVRGSFGFVLEEAAVDDAMLETELSVVLEQVSEIISEIASPDNDQFENALTDMDRRLLIGLKRFFSVLDDGSANLRLVHRDVERVLERHDVQRGRARIDRTEIEESETTSIVGLLIGILPEHRKFELRRTDTGEIIYGAVDAKLAKQILTAGLIVTSNPVGKVWRTHMSIREVRRPGIEVKLSYVLKELVQEVT